MTEKKAVGSSYIINFIYFLVRYWMSHWSKIVRQDTTNRNAALYAARYFLYLDFCSASPRRGNLSLLEQLHNSCSVSTATRLPN